MFPVEFYSTGFSLPQIMKGVLGPVPAMKISYLSYNNSDMRIISDRLSEH